MRRNSKADRKDHYSIHSEVTDDISSSVGLTTSDYTELEDLIIGHCQTIKRNSNPSKLSAGSEYTYFEVPSDTLPNLGEEFLTSFIPVERLSQVHPKLEKFYHTAHAGSIFCFFRQLENAKALMNSAWFLSVCSRHNKDNGILCSSIPVTAFDNFARVLVNMLDEYQAAEKRLANIYSLTKRELEVIKMISKGMKRCEVSRLLKISIHTLDTHRRNIRRKLKLGCFSDVIRYARSFGLVG